MVRLFVGVLQKVEGVAGNVVVVHGGVFEAGGEVVEEAAGAFKVAALPGDLGDGIFFQEGLVLRAVEVVGEVRWFSGGKGGEVEEDAAVDVEEVLLKVQLFLAGHGESSFRFWYPSI